MFLVEIFSGNRQLQEACIKIEYAHTSANIINWKKFAAQIPSGPIHPL